MAIAGIVASVSPGLAKNLLLDRPRILLARGHAAEQGLSKKWLLEMFTGSPTNDIVPITGGQIKLGSRVLLNRSWQRSYQWGNAINASLLGAGLMIGLPNLIDGIQKDGIDGAINTRSGRTGTFALAGSMVDIAVMGAAIAGAIRHGGSGSLFTRVMAQPIHSQSSIVFGRMALGLPVLVNEAGFFDFLNKNETRTAGEVARDVPGKWIDQAREILHLGQSEPA